MSSLKLTFLALTQSIDLELQWTDERNSIALDFIEVFATSIDYVNFKIALEPLQQNTIGLKEKINAVVQKYKDFEPKIQRLNTYFKNLKEDEYFFFFPNSEISSEESHQYYTYLAAQENNIDFSQYENQIRELFGELKEKYEMISFSEETKRKIGEPDKTKRVCRFCNKDSSEVRFQKIAHSISEALGNKKIITNDECDSCNEKFGTGIETDLILYLDLYRTVFGIKGKNGVPKLQGKNKKLTVENTGSKIEITQELTDEEIDDPNRDDFKIRIEAAREITIQNMYRSLVKYALGVIDRSYLDSFSETIAWVNQSKDFGDLPKVAMLLSYDLFTRHPQLVLYIRKDDDNNLPYAVAEFRFAFLTFVYIIPKSSKDDRNFNNKDDYDRFWKLFKHYSSTPNWKFNNMNDNTSRKFVVNLKFEPKQKPHSNQGSQAN